MGKNLNNPYVLVQDSLKILPKRTKDVIVRRFGINRNRETLESIGKNYSITRERVRQIEEDGLSRLKKDEAAIIFKPVVSRLSSYLNNCGGMRKEDSLLSDVSSSYLPKAFNKKDHSQCSQALGLILTISDPFHYLGESDQMHPIWTVNEDSVKDVQAIVKGLVSHLNSHKNTMPEKDIMTWLASNMPEASENAHSSYLDAAKLVKKNIFGEYGLANWAIVTPRGVKDKAYLVFKKSEKPLHFADVANLINEMGISTRKAYVQTVHNELIKDKRFVLVGRGLYALTEWGYAPGTVKDVIKEVLRSSKGKMTKQNIIDEVLKKRVVKVNTIALNIQNAPEFKRLEGDVYMLEE